MARSEEHRPRAWARLRVDVNCALRRGAWYRAVRLTPSHVDLEVIRERVSVPRRLLQTLFAKPARWSVVSGAETLTVNCIDGGFTLSAPTLFNLAGTSSDVNFVQIQFVYAAGGSPPAKLQCSTDSGASFADC